MWKESARYWGKRTGTTWEIDAKGVNEGSQAIVLVEARRYTTRRLNQESMAAVAYRIHDTGAARVQSLFPRLAYRRARSLSRARKTSCCCAISQQYESGIPLAVPEERHGLAFLMKQFLIGCALVGGSLETVDSIQRGFTGSLEPLPRSATPSGSPRPPPRRL